MSETAYIRELRRRTGYDLASCYRALDAAFGDLELAYEILRGETSPSKIIKDRFEILEERIRALEGDQ